MSDNDISAKVWYLARRVREQWQKSGVCVWHCVEAFFCLDFFVTFFIKKKS